MSPLDPKGGLLPKPQQQAHQVGADGVFQGKLHVGSDHLQIAWGKL